jgi:predicted transglutaminase-like protease
MEMITIKVNLKENKIIKTIEEEIFDEKGEFPIYAEKNRRYWLKRQNGKYFVYKEENGKMFRLENEISEKKARVIIANAEFGIYDVVPIEDDLLNLLNIDDAELSEDGEFTLVAE